MRKISFLLGLLMLFPSCVHANQALHVQCQLGGQRVSTSGLLSSTYVQASYPGCTVTVYFTGTTTKASLYSDNNLSPTPLSNPFTTDATGYGVFYAANSRYDIVLSGGGLASPVTYVDVQLFDPPATETWPSPGVAVSTGTAWGVSGVLPSSTTGTTQARGDNSTKVATTAYADLYRAGLFSVGSGSPTTISGAVYNDLYINTDRTAGRAFWRCVGAGPNCGSWSLITNMSENWTFGTVDPSAGAFSGDFYLNRTSGEIFQWDAGLTSWISQGVISTSGTAGNLSGTPALPNGTTATTQSQGDNSTKVATTAYADAAAKAQGQGISAVSFNAGSPTLQLSDNGKVFQTSCGGCTYTLPNPVPSLTWFVILQNASSTSAFFISNPSGLGSVPATIGPGTSVIVFTRNDSPWVFEAMTFGVLPNATPSDTATCQPGQMWFDVDFLYACTASGTVKRSALSSY